MRGGGEREQDGTEVKKGRMMTARQKRREFTDEGREMFLGGN